MSAAQQSRQVLLWGESNQSRLGKTRIGIVGSTLCAQYVAAGCSALGVGSLTLMDGARVSMRDTDLFVERNRLGDAKVASLARIVTQLCPTIDVHTLPVSHCYEVFDSFKPDIIVNCIGDPALTGYARSRRRKCIDVVFDDTSVQVGSVKEYTLQNGSAVLSCIAAGSVCNSIRKHAISLEGDVRQKRFTYQSQLPHFGGAHDVYNDPILVVGAGALGNFAAATLALSGFNHIDIVDDDTVDVTNMNRQILLYGALENKKASVLARRVMRIRPRVKAHAYVKRMSARSRFPKKYAAVLGCVDNNSTRKMLSTFARRKGIPYIDGGTSSLSGAVYSYVPGISACVSCQKNLDFLIAQDEERRVQQRGCAVAAPSVVTPNCIIGSLLVEQMQHALFSSGMCAPLKYDGNRGVVHTVSEYQKECRCS